MPEYLAPAVFVEETSFRAKSIEGVGTSTAAFVGMTARGPTASDDSDPTPPLLTSYTDFERYFGGTDDLSIGGNAAPNYLAHAARAFFNNGGGRLYVARVLGTGSAKAASGQRATRGDLVIEARAGGELRAVRSVDLVVPPANGRLRIARLAVSSQRREPCHI